MDYFIAKCVRMADIFAKINDKCKVRKILTDDEYELFLEMFNVYSAFRDDQTQQKNKSKGDCTNG